MGDQTQPSFLYYSPNKGGIIIQKNLIDADAIVKTERKVIKDISVNIDTERKVVKLGNKELFVAAIAAIGSLLSGISAIVSLF